MPKIEGVTHDKRFLSRKIAKSLARDVSAIFEDKTLSDRKNGIVYHAHEASIFVLKVGLFYGEEALEFFAKQDANEGREQIDRRGTMLANFEHDSSVSPETRESIGRLLVARSTLADTNTGEFAAEIVRYEPRAKLARHTDNVRTTAISLNGTGVMFIGPDTQDEQRTDLLRAGHAVTMDGNVPHRVVSGSNTYRHVLLLTDKLPVIE